MGNKVSPVTKNANQDRQEIRFHNEKQEKSLSTLQVLPQKTTFHNSSIEPPINDGTKELSSPKHKLFYTILKHASEHREKADYLTSNAWLDSRQKFRKNRSHSSPSAFGKDHEGCEGHSSQNSVIVDNFFTSASKDTSSVLTNIHYNTFLIDDQKNLDLNSEVSFNDATTPNPKTDGVDAKGVPSITVNVHKTGPKRNLKIRKRSSPVKTSTAVVGKKQKFTSSPNSTRQNNRNSILSNAHVGNNNMKDRVKAYVSTQHTISMDSDSLDEDGLGNEQQSMEFIYSHIIPYIIFVPSNCTITTEGPRVYITLQSQKDKMCTSTHQNRFTKERLNHFNHHNLSQILIQVLTDNSLDCIDLALKEWPYAHWERISLPSIHPYKPTLVQSLHKSDNANVKGKNIQNIIHNAKIHSCRTMHTIPARRINTTNQEGSVDYRYIWNVSDKTIEIPNSTRVWIRLTIYILDAGNGMFYWLTGITESDAPKEIPSRKRIFQGPTIPYVLNQVSVYTPELFDPIRCIILENSFEFPMWKDCTWSNLEETTIPNLAIRTPPLWKKVNELYIVSPIQLLSNDGIQEHFFVSIFNIPQVHGIDSLNFCSNAIVERNILAPNVEVIRSKERITIEGKMAMYSIFSAMNPNMNLNGALMKMVVNLETYDKEKQLVITYVSSCGFRSMGIWQKFLKEICFGPHSLLMQNLSQTNDFDVELFPNEDFRNMYIETQEKFLKLCSPEGNIDISNHEKRALQENSLSV